jgi:Kdo2-lipid IVA lauroyltransferase/acyltransferase
LKLLHHLYTIYFRFILRRTEKQMYRISRCLSWILFTIIGYRKEIVLQNLSRAFPSKPVEDIRRIRRQFYRQFTDIFHEMIYFSRYDREALLARVHFVNPELITQFIQQGRSVIVAAGHCGSWELLGLTLPLVTGCTTYGAAKKQSDPFFNRVINDLRTRMGLEIIESASLYRTLLRRQGEPFVAYLIADQTPPKHETDYWTQFMHQDTPVFLGPEHIARAMNLVVVFAEMHRKQQGRYEVTFRLITDKAQQTEEYAITERYIRLLEDVLNCYPESWLWSHRRWKHQRDRKH